MRYLSLLLAALPGVLADIYSLTDSYVGEDFLSGWVHENIADPTHGRVNYVDQATALAQNLTYANGDTLIMRADYWTTLDPNGPGRNSVRIRSNNVYSTHVVVLDARHMPQGCSTWPAFWETTENGWPAGGEADIVEGVNDQADDQITLHTNPGCTMPSGAGPMTGAAGNLDCEGNNGCGVTAVNSANSFGPDFNNNGGGWYAMERNDDFIKVWFWPRNGGFVPGDVSSGASSVNTDGWGLPVAYFPNTQCNLDQYFAPNNIIFDLTLCGDWAGAAGVYPSSCPQDCTSNVNYNPGSFYDAYWDVASVLVYENPIADPSYQIHPNGNTAKCLDVQAGVIANGTPVQIYDCNGTDAQKWLISRGQTAVQVAGTEFCLDAGDTPGNGVQLKIWECFPDITAQTWYYTDDNRIALMNQQQCLDDNLGNQADGTIAQIWACTADDVYQIWTVS